MRLDGMVFIVLGDPTTVVLDHLASYVVMELALLKLPAPRVTPVYVTRYEV